MTHDERAQVIMESIDRVYTIPTYLEKTVKREIIKGLMNADKEEKKE